MGKSKRDAVGLCWFIIGFSSLVVFQSCTDWQQFIDIENLGFHHKVVESGFGNNQSDQSLADSKAAAGMWLQIQNHKVKIQTQIEKLLLRQKRQRPL